MDEPGPEWLNPPPPKPGTEEVTIVSIVGGDLAPYVVVDRDGKVLWMDETRERAGTWAEEHGYRVIDG